MKRPVKTSKSPPISRNSFSQFSQKRRKFQAADRHVMIAPHVTCGSSAHQYVLFTTAYSWVTVCNKNIFQYRWRKLAYRDLLSESSREVNNLLDGRIKLITNLPIFYTRAHTHTHNHKKAFSFFYISTWVDKQLH